MDTVYVRQTAVHQALELAKIAGNATVENLVATAVAITAFIAAAPDKENYPVALAQAPAADAASAKEEPAAPKARGKKAAGTATTPAGSTETQASDSAAAKPDTSASTGDKETDDLFGEDPAPVKEEKAKAVTVDEVRAALVAVQTKLGHKDHAIALLSKHTTDGKGVLSSLKPESHAALVAACDAAIKAGKPIAKV